MSANFSGPRRARAPVHSIALAALLALAAGPGGAHAAWLPLQVGFEWSYVDTGDDPHLEVITETGHVRGRPVYVKSYVGGQDDGLFNFWQEGPGGSVLLAGYYRPAYPFGLVYEPPVQVFPAQPSIGLSWTTHTVAIAIPDDAFYAEFDIDWSVQEQVTLQVPAGGFPCFGVGPVPPSPALAAPDGLALGLDGRVLAAAPSALAPGPSSATEWYADGVGLVQYDTGERYVLQSANLPTPAARSSWGRLKRLYH